MVSIVFAFNLSWATQLSEAGVKTIVPCQKLIRKGVTLSVLVAKVCDMYSTSEKSRLIISFCFLTLTPSTAAVLLSTVGSTSTTGPVCKANEFVLCFGLRILFAWSILLFLPSLMSWVENDVKLSTKNPDLNLFRPFASGINWLAVFVSRIERVV